MVDPLRFDGRIVVVTGAGGGMGRLHALELGARGAAVIVNDLPTAVDGDRESSGSAAAVAQEISSAGGVAIAVAADVGSVEGCQELVDRTIGSYGAIDALIANAGIAPSAPLSELTPSDLTRVVDVNLLGPIHLTRLMWPHMVARGGGRVLYISSAAGLYGAPGFAHYGPAKAGLLSLAKIVSLEGAGSGIVANALAVGSLTAAMEEILRKEIFGDRAAEIEWWRTNMRPELTTPAAVWLIHPQCPARGRAFESRGGRVAEVIVGETRGYINPNQAVEDLQENVAAIQDRSHFFSPAQSSELAAYERQVLQEWRSSTRQSGRSEAGCR